ncbi:MAG: sugar ABC transporter permease [Chloroflexi bacterium]|nr:sugar ABC transporter permease [Chloroflexota bacterium]
MKGLAWDRVVSIVLITPSVIAVAVFVYGFIGWTGWVSLSKWDGLRPNYDLAGWVNFDRLLNNSRFQIDVRNTIVFTLLFLAACLIIGLLLAILLDQKIRGENLFRSLFLFPMAVSFIVTGVVWRWLMVPSSGLNTLFAAAGLDFLKSAWYTSPTVLHIQPESGLAQVLARVGLGGLASPNFGLPLALISIVIAAAWQMSGFVMAMFLAGIRGIPEELRDAARVDGASEVQVYRHVVLPLLKPVTLSAAIVLGHISLKIFDLVASLSKQGPGFATDVPAFFMFQTTFQGDHFAQGSAIAVFMLLSVSLLVIPYLVYNIRREIEV